MYSHRRIWRIRNAFVIIIIFSLIPASLDLFGMGAWQLPEYSAISVAHFRKPGEVSPKRAKNSAVASAQLLFRCLTVKCRFVA